MTRVFLVGQLTVLATRLTGLMRRAEVYERWKELKEDVLFKIVVRIGGVDSCGDKCGW